MDEARGTDRETASDAGTVGRRALVTGGLAGIVASALTRLEQANADDVVASQPLHLGEDNVASATTSLSQDGPGPALRVENPGDGSGIQVLANRSAALVGLGTSLPSTPQYTFVDGSVGEGVIGAGDRFGVVGSALPDGVILSIPGATTVAMPIGVWGRSGPLPARSVISHPPDTQSPGIGVWGSTAALPGFAPISKPFPMAGVAGTAFGPGQTAVFAHNPGGTALQVEGGISITCGGTGVVPRGAREVEVSDATITPNSVVVATLTGDPGNRGATLQHVTVTQGSLRVVLTAPPNEDTPFNYLCFELV